MFSYRMKLLCVFSVPVATNIDIYYHNAQTLFSTVKFCQMKVDLKSVFKFLDNLFWLPFSKRYRNFFEKSYFLYVHADLDIAFLQYSLV